MASEYKIEYFIPTSTEKKNDLLLTKYCGIAILVELETKKRFVGVTIEIFDTKPLDLTKKYLLFRMNEGVYELLCE